MLMNIQYIKGDLFALSPARSILAHACNARGSWGGGVARIFAEKFPAAYRQYRDHCNLYHRDPRQLLGTCLLIHVDATNLSPEHWIACLFTSVGHGASVDPPNIILDATKKALIHLYKQLHDSRYTSTVLPGESYPPLIYMPKINSGLFRVPWNDTEAVLIETRFPYVVYELD